MSINKHLYQATSLCVYLISILSFYIYLRISGQSELETLFFYALFPALFIYILPEIFIHIKYTNVNGGYSLKQLRNGNLLLEREGEKTEIHANEIKKIIVYLTISEAFNGFKILPASNYFYALINLKDGRRICITSLLDLDLRLIRRCFSKQYERKISLFCWPNEKKTIQVKE